MNTKLLFFCLFFLASNAFGQKIYLTKNPIYLDVIKQYIYVFSKQDSSIRTNRGDLDTRYIKVFKLTSKGAMHFIFNDTTSNNIVEGQYAEANKISKPKGYLRDGVRVGTSEDGTAHFYYRPQRDGIWFYYNNVGILIKKERYKKGTLLK